MYFRRWFCPIEHRRDQVHFGWEMMMTTWEGVNILGPSSHVPPVLESGVLNQTYKTHVNN